MKLKPYEFRDPGAIVRVVEERVGLSDGDAFLVVVERPDTNQTVRCIASLDVDDDAMSEDLSELFRELMEHDLDVPEWSRTPIRHAVMTIVVRRGLTVFGRRESRWLDGWRYSNHFRHAYTGDVTLVTEHGWADFMSGLGDIYPRLALGSRG